MENVTTIFLEANTAGLNSASQALSDGGLVAFPTETVYGLGADARNGRAVAQIFEAKGRPAFNPLIIHVATQEMAAEIAVFNDAALHLAAAFWPGPLTLVLPLRPEAGLSSLVTAGLNSVGIRLPEHPVAQQLLTAFGGPVAAPSANRSGRISPTTAAHVAAGLSGRINVILDAGACSVGLESTIIGFDPVPTLLRAGGLPTEAIEACLGAPLASHTPSETPNAPGQLSSHYAPNAKIRLNATTKNPGELKLGFGPDPDADLNLSPSGDLTEAAANLFHHLHELDAKNAPIAVAAIPNKGLGIAINDRLTRAAAPRP
ncbi:translation factor Sua5 [Marinosulfonomonas sp. PRT-SC04]|nr:translation factor Sua5 [Marinosulfonomonas sp. PRT-SC04]